MKSVNESIGTFLMFQSGDADVVTGSGVIAAEHQGGSVPPGGGQEGQAETGEGVDRHGHGLTTGSQGEIHRIRK